MPDWPRIPGEGKGSFYGYGKFYEVEAMDEWYRMPGLPSSELEVENGSVWVRNNNLLKLGIDSNNNTDLSSLKKFKPGAIQILSLPRQNKIDSRAIPNIAHLTGLKALYFGGAKITNQDLAKLTALENLLKLDLSGCPIDDGAVEHLLEMDSLKFLRLYDTGITAEGMERLEQGLPDCLIRWRKQ